MSEPFLGEIRITGFNFAPAGWAFCNGALLPINEYTALFALLGTTFGGNGINTFALPDLRGRVPVGMGSGPGLQTYVMGEIAGSETVTLTTAQLPAHRHGLGANTGAATTTDPNLTIPAAGNAYTTAAENTVMKGTFETGGGQPVPVLQPLLAINFIIALQGIFPSQN